MLYAQRAADANNIAYPLKPPSSQETGSHPGKARSYEPKLLNETMLTISHTQRKTLPILIPISTKKNPHREQIKNKKKKKQEEN